MSEDDPHKSLRKLIYKKWDDAMDSLLEDIDDEFCIAKIAKTDRKKILVDAVDSDLADLYSEYLEEGEDNND